MKKITKNFKKTLELYKKRKKLVVAIIFLLAILFPFYISIRDIVIDSIPFWYDPARDMLMAWDSLKKPTLIGPPSGIPGVFYGPHWVWFLAFGLLFSKDPRVTTTLIMTIPYFTIFPLLFFRFAKFFGKRIIILLWLFFIFGYKTYTTFIWSVHLAPLFFLILSYLFIFTDLHERKAINYLKISFAGIFAGLLISVHISFGIVMTLSSFIFLLVEYFLTTERKHWAKNFINRLKMAFSFVLGLLISLSPIFLFEVRHEFNQIKAVIYTITQALIYHSPVVGYIGLSKQAIIQEFLSIMGRLLNVPIMTTFFVYAAIIIYVVFKRQNYLSIMDKSTKKLSLYLAVCMTTMLGIYLNSKNPVWSYHLVGSEILILLFLGFVLTRFSLLRALLAIWALYLIFSNIKLLKQPSEISLYKFSNLATKKYIVETIYQDTQKEPFAVFAYSTAIYTFDYDYIFRWFSQEKYPNQAPQDPKDVKYVYLIIPRIADALRVDFINYRTPPKEYQTAKEWRIPDGMLILKREKLGN